MNYCVYIHKFTSGKMYVGAGNDKRPYDITKRYDKWLIEYAKDKVFPKVSIVNQFDTAVEAASHEREIYDLLHGMAPEKFSLQSKPTGVLSGFQRSDIQGKLGKVGGECKARGARVSNKSRAPVYTNEEGVSFQGAVEASKVLGITPKRIRANPQKFNLTVIRK